MEDRKFNRRDFLSIGALTVAGVALAGCAPESTATPEPAGEEQPTATTEAAQPAVEIDWWTIGGTEEFGTEEMVEEMLAEFEKSPAGSWVDVNPTFLPDDGFSEKMTTVIGTGSGVPDVAFLWDPGWLPRATDLTEYIERDNFDIGIYNQLYFDMLSRYDDKIVGLPLGLGANFYFYNKALLEESGVAFPEWGYTMDQWLEDIKAIGDPDQKIYGGRVPGLWSPNFYAFGARPFSEDGTTVEGYLNGPKAVRAFEFMYDLASSGAVPTSAEMEVLQTEGTGPVDLFMSGRLAFAQLNQGHFRLIDEAGVDYGLVHTPTVEGEDIIHNGWSLLVGIPAASEKKDAAWEWLKWYVGEPGQRFFMLYPGSTFIPSIPALLEDHPSADDERYKFFFRILNETYLINLWKNQFSYIRQVERVCSDLYDKIYLGEIDRDEIKGELDALVPEAQQTVDEEREALGM